MTLCPRMMAVTISRRIYFTGNNVMLYPSFFIKFCFCCEIFKWLQLITPEVLADEARRGGQCLALTITSPYINDTGISIKINEPVP